MPTTTEQEAIQCFLEFIKSSFPREFASSITARGVYGCIDHDDGDPERYSIKLISQLGDRFTGSAPLLTDAQSGWIGELPSKEASVAEPADCIEMFSISDLWAQVRDETASIQRRIAAVQRLLGVDRDSAILFVVEELSRAPIHKDWIGALVFLAEHVHFSGEQQPVVRDALLRIARMFGTSTTVGADRVVWSAIRRASSLLTPAQANLLVPFLERRGVVDGRAVTLKCIEKLFFPAPPANPESVQSIGDRAHTLAMKFLDPDIFGGGEHALLAQSAVCALAAIGDPRLGDAATSADALNKRWLKHQLRARLGALRASWQSKDAAITNSAPFRNLETELTKLG